MRDGACEYCGTDAVCVCPNGPLNGEELGCLTDLANDGAHRLIDMMPWYGVGTYPGDDERYGNLVEAVFEGLVRYRNGT